MKKGILVTERNLPTVFGHIKNALRNKESIWTRNVWTDNLKTARKRLISFGKSKEAEYSLTENGVCPILSQSSEVTLKDKKLKIVGGLGVNLIAICHPQSGWWRRIEIGSRVLIEKNRILILEKNPLKEKTPKDAFEVWELN